MEYCKDYLCVAGILSKVQPRSVPVPYTPLEEQVLLSYLTDNLSSAEIRQVYPPAGVKGAVVYDYCAGLDPAIKTSGNRALLPLCSEVILRKTKSRKKSHYPDPLLEHYLRPEDKIAAGSYLRILDANVRPICDKEDMQLLLYLDLVGNNYDSYGSVASAALAAAGRHLDGVVNLPEHKPMQGFAQPEAEWIENTLARVNRTYPAYIAGNALRPLSALKADVNRCRQKLISVKDPGQHEALEQMVFDTLKSVASAITAAQQEKLNEYQRLHQQVMRLRYNTPFLSKLSRDYRSAIRDMQDRKRTLLQLTTDYHTVLGVFIFNGLLDGPVP
ncbi:MAG: hypothetical protein ABH879_06490 [archaeon]